MTTEQLERRTKRIKKKLKKRHIWSKGYLEEMARNQVHIMINQWTNHSSGEEKIIRFLLKRGFSTDQIYEEAKAVGKTIRDHQVYLAKINTKRGKHKRKKKK